MPRPLSSRFGHTERATLCRTEMATARSGTGFFITQRSRRYSPRNGAPPTGRGAVWPSSATRARHTPGPPFGATARTHPGGLGSPGGPGPPRQGNGTWQQHAGGVSLPRRGSAGGQAPRRRRWPACPGGRPGTGRPGVPGVSPRETLRATAKPATGPAKIERRRVATGANHPASHSSAFRRGPGTPAGAPTGDQSTMCMLHRNPPLWVKTGLPGFSASGSFPNRGTGPSARGVTGSPGR